ncbi:MAG TPA: hypothetical protein VGD78_17765 [Chthoniobacterales bacterium]
MPRFPAPALVLLWSGTVLAGSLGLTWYSFRPGPNAIPPKVWPATNRLALGRQGFTLVLFAHPRCPCTRASLEELARLMDGKQNRLRAYVVFFSPGTADGEWSRTDLWRWAGSIAGVTALRDPDGTQAQLFGAETSGQTVVYDSGGNVVFTGGITSARGHVGESEGSDAIEALLGGDKPRLRTTPAFGCALAASP